MLELSAELSLPLVTDITEYGSRKKYIVIGIIRTILGIVFGLISILLVFISNRVGMLFLSIPLFIYCVYLISVVNYKSYVTYRDNAVNGVVSKSNTQYYRFD